MGCYKTTNEYTKIPFIDMLTYVYFVGFSVFCQIITSAVSCLDNALYASVLSQTR